MQAENSSPRSQEHSTSLHGKASNTGAESPIYFFFKVNFIITINSDFFFHQQH
jgi:hypothetical protein